MHDLIDGLTTMAHHPGVTAYLIGVAIAAATVLFLFDAVLRGFPRQGHDQ